MEQSPETPVDTGRREDDGGFSRTLHRNAEAERADGWLRLVGSFVAGVCGVAVVLGTQGQVRWVWLAIVLLVGMGWLFSFRRSRADFSGDRLRIDPNGVRWSLQGKAVDCAWGDIDTIEGDEERIAIQIKLHDGQTHALPSVWRGAGLYDLTDFLLEARSHYAVG